MRFLTHQSPVWTSEDLAAVAERLAAQCPRLSPQLRRAIVSFAAQEVKPARGREQLLQLASRYARECPRTIGMEAALSS
jgi:hypothetical protein